jgi:hypothetical protein
MLWAALRGVGLRAGAPTRRHDVAIVRSALAHLDEVDRVIAERERAQGIATTN